MKNEDLKSVWHEIHVLSNDESKVNIGRIIGMNHSKLVSKVLSDQKLKVILYILFFAIYLSLMLYAFVFLKLKLSVSSLIPLSLAGLFIFSKITSEFNRFRFLTKTADNMSIKESIVFFSKELKRISNIDLIVNLIFFYTVAIGTILVGLTDISGIKNFWPFLIILILALLFIPWFLKYQDHQRYQRINSNLKDSLSYLNDVS